MRAHSIIILDNRGTAGEDGGHRGKLSPTIAWFRGAAVERWSSTGELSLSCTRSAVDG